MKAILPARPTARAVQAAHAFGRRDPFLVLNADNLYPASVLRALVDVRFHAVTASDATGQEARP